MERLALLEVVEDTWRQLNAALSGLDEAAMVEPGVVEGWSVKDLLGHVAAWEQMALRHIDQWRRGETPGGTGDFSVDAYNATESTRRRDWPLQKVQADAGETRERLRATLQSMADDEWHAVTGEGERRQTLGDWVGGALGGAAGPGTHAADHAQHIQAWRRAREHTVAL